MYKIKTSVQKIVTYFFGKQHHISGQLRKKIKNWDIYIQLKFFLFSLYIDYKKHRSIKFDVIF